MGQSIGIAMRKVHNSYNNNRKIQREGEEEAKKKKISTLSRTGSYSARTGDSEHTYEHELEKKCTHTNHWMETIEQNERGQRRRKHNNGEKRKNNSNNSALEER